MMRKIVWAIRQGFLHENGLPGGTFPLAGAPCIMAPLEECFQCTIGLSGRVLSAQDSADGLPSGKSAGDFWFRKSLRRTVSLKPPVFSSFFIASQRMSLYM